MTSKTQDKTEVESPNDSIPPDAEEEGSTDTIPQSIIPPIFNIRANFRNIYINPITNPSTNINNNNNGNNKIIENELLSPSQPKLDEFCIQWCKQKDINRNKTIVPECKMLCFRKFNNQFKKDLLLKKVMVKEELKRQQNNNNDNAVQVLYNENENEGRNFLDGYYLYYIKGLEECQKHTEGMKNDEISNRSTWIQNNPEEYEIDLGEKYGQTKSETKRIIRRAFTPGYQFAKRYLESWSDGTQSSFFKRFYESVQRMDAVHIMQDNVKKAVEVWVDGGNDGNEGISGNENNGNDKNIGREDDSSDKRNEKS